MYWYDQRGKQNTQLEECCQELLSKIKGNNDYETIHNWLAELHQRDPALFRSVVTATNREHENCLNIAIHDCWVRSSQRDPTAVMAVVDVLLDDPGLLQQIVRQPSNILRLPSGINMSELDYGELSLDPSRWNCLLMLHYDGKAGRRLERERAKILFALMRKQLHDLYTELCTDVIKSSVRALGVSESGYNNLLLQVGQLELTALEYNRHIRDEQREQCRESVIQCVGQLLEYANQCSANYSSITIFQKFKTWLQDSFLAIFHSYRVNARKNARLLLQGNLLTTSRAWTEFLDHNTSSVPPAVDEPLAAQRSFDEAHHRHNPN